ncbi:hypothetical protein PUNSTDRAFT_51078 [Punctularia strigosozonata HHB-11173 SS5]|uniref:uncharacterized protein n=1 Tax=Punctularia strigosozonata (strain HHB-11173) TaxID=741275 RepID=UPI000441734A|nr:uncharacterized protein PUNSTDRAFT_51078 [Punctularia strigosozonata HHB-11173 SS5]EIN10444.1 hypothetical protein PUNSTDRAFT_51078 [Punctularia strigosozonata HHB-11173 SS5]
MCSGRDASTFWMVTSRPCTYDANHRRENRNGEDTRFHVVEYSNKHAVYGVRPITAAGPRECTQQRRPWTDSCRSAKRMLMTLRGIPPDVLWRGVSTLCLASLRISFRAERDALGSHILCILRRTFAR